MPEFTVYPRHAGDEAVRLDRAQDRARLGVDLVDLAVAMLADPERALGPGQARVVALAGCRKGRNYRSRRGVDFLNATVSELVEVAPVERGAGVGCDADGAHSLAARRVERAERIA